MLKKLILLFVGMFLIASLVSGVSALDAERSFSKNIINVSNSIVVSIDVTGSSAGVYGLDEFIPSGWSVSSISDSGEFESGVIHWLFLDNNDRTLTYTATAPSIVGTYGFSGEYTDGETVFFTSGETQVTVQSGSTPPANDTNVTETVYDDLLVNYVRGQIMINGEYAESGRDYKIDILNGNHVGKSFVEKVDNETFIPSTSRDEGRYDTGDKVEFITGDRFKISLVGYEECYAEGVFDNGGNNGVNLNCVIEGEDITPPLVDLTSPSDGDDFNVENVDFEFYVEDNKATSLTCELIANGVLRGSKSVANGSTNIFSNVILADGNYNVYVRCHDGRQYGNSDTINIDVDAPNAPVLNPIGNKNVEENSTLSFTISATDDPSESLPAELFFRANELPAGATFNNNHDGSASFSWVPNFEQSGTYSVTFIVNDTSGMEDNETIQIKVSDYKELFKDIDRCENGKLTPDTLKIKIKDPDDGDEFDVGEIIEGELEIENDADEDMKVEVEVYLYDLDDDNVEEDLDDDIKVKDGDEEDFEFKLEVPYDVDDRHDFALFVKVSAEEDEDYCNEAWIEIEIERPDDLVVIKELNLNPSTVEDGDYVQAEVKVQNYGSDDQDDVYIKLEVPGLGYEEESDRFELEEYDDDDRATRVFNFRVPVETTEGNYEVIATVYYQDGDEEDSETETLMVEDGGVYHAGGSGGGYYIGDPIWIGGKPLSSGPTPSGSIIVSEMPDGGRINIGTYEDSGIVLCNEEPGINVHLETIPDYQPEKKKQGVICCYTGDRFDWGAWANNLFSSENSLIWWIVVCVVLLLAILLIFFLIVRAL